MRNWLQQPENEIQDLHSVETWRRLKSNGQDALKGLGPTMLAETASACIVEWGNNLTALFNVWEWRIDPNNIDAEPWDNLERWKLIRVEPQWART